MKLQHDLISAWRRFAALFGRSRRARDVRAEVEFHLAMRQQEFQRAGMASDAAATAARRQFGNVALLTEKTHDMWKWPSFESVVADVRYAVRNLVRTPAFSIVAVLVLAIGIGANTAMFSLVDAMLLRGLPYPDTNRLVLLIGNVQRQTVERRGNSVPDYLDWRKQATSFDDMAAYNTFTMTLFGADEPERVTIESVSPSYFGLLGATPSHGRTFRDDEDVDANRDFVVVLGDAVWRQHFGADPNIVNTTIKLSGQAYTVIGIMPPGFTGITDTGQIWLPFVFSGYPNNARGSRGFQTLARLKSGVSIDQARAEMNTISARLEAAYPDTNAKRGVEISPLQVETYGQLQPIVLTLMAAVSFVLLIACANVANLLIGRSEARQKEIAVRTALGAGRARLIRQMITESCVLTAIGALAGLFVAQTLVRVGTLASPVQFPSFVQPTMNAKVLVFTVGVALLAGLVLGLAPAMHARLVRLTEVLKDSSRGSSGGARAQRLRGVLIVTEVALAIVLFIGAGLMIRSTQKLAAIDPGFDTSNLLTVTVSVPRVPAPPAATPAPGQPAPPPPPFLVSGRELIDRVRAVPGVTSVGLSSDVPLDGSSGSAVFYSAEGDTTTDAQTMPRAYVHAVSPEFFDSMHMPLRGRTFRSDELAANSSVVIVSEALVKRFWPNQDPTGKRIKLGRPSPTNQNPWLTIVGSVPEIKYRALPANPTADPDLYFPAVDRSPQPLLIRTSVPPLSVLPSVRAAIRRDQPSLAVFATAAVEDLVAQQTSASRFTMWVLSLFAGTALLLSVIGIYGVMSYLVTQRMREFGIRLALGASSREIVGVVLRQGIKLIAIGAVLGIVVSISLSQLFAGLLFDVTPRDAAAAPLAIGVLLTAAVLACVVPAVRATRVNPVETLRQ